MNAKETLCDQALALASHYSRATGISCRVLDAGGKEIYRDSSLPSSCVFCADMRKITGLGQNCRAEHGLSAQQAEYLGGNYIYFCPSGFVFWTSSIIKNGKRAASIIAGSVLLITHDKYAEEESANRYGAKATADQLQNIIYVPPKRIASLAEMLFLACYALSDEESSPTLSPVKASYQTLCSEQAPKEALSLHSMQELQLMSSAAAGDFKETRQVLNEILHNAAKDAKKTFNELKDKALDLTAMLSRAVLESGAAPEEIFNLNVSCLEEIPKKRTLEELSLWLNKISLAFCNAVFRINSLKHSDSMGKAARYIHKRFADNISLEDVAQNVKLSPSYFSRIFKTEMQMSFTEYLNKARIDESKRLLKNTNLSLAEIAGKCGFADQSYYSKIFKKNQGLSPGKFRAALRGSKKTILL